MFSERRGGSSSKTGSQCEKCHGSRENLIPELWERPASDAGGPWALGSVCKIGMTTPAPVTGPPGSLSLAE